MRAAELDDDDQRPIRIPLSVNDPNAGDSLTRSVDRMLRDGRSRTPVVVELHGTHLPATLVAALIGNLRRLRAAGGTLAAVATTPALRNAMAVHGLDRVLASSSRTSERAPRPHSRAGETGWPMFALLLLVVTIASVIALLQQSPGI